MERLPGEVPIPVAGPDGSRPVRRRRARRRSPPTWSGRSRACTPSTGGARPRLPRRSPGPGAPPPRASWRAGRRASTRAGCRSTRRSAEALGWLRRHLPATPDDHARARRLPARELPGRARRRAPRALTGVLDWEMVHLGDPLEDVAWCISPLWRGGTPFAVGPAAAGGVRRRAGPTATRPRSRCRSGWRSTACSRSSR